jgi:hypothetical protein
MNPVSFSDLAPQSHQGIQELLALLNYRQLPKYTTLATSAARTSYWATTVQRNYGYSGIALLLNVTAASGTGGLKMGLDMCNPANTITQKLGTSPAAFITAIGQYCAIFYPGAAGNATWTPNPGGVNTCLPEYYTASVVVGDASSYTYQLDACLLP